MNKGDLIYTPRFCYVEVKEVFENWGEAQDAGYKEPTHYHKNGYGIAGKSLDRYHMEFAAYKE